MFSWSEILLIAVVALIFIGPKELPAVLRKLGQLDSQASPLRRRVPPPFRGIDAGIRGYQDLHKNIQDLLRPEPVQPAQGYPRKRNQPGLHAKACARASRDPSATGYGRGARPALEAGASECLRCRSGSRQPLAYAGRERPGSSVPRAAARTAPSRRRQCPGQSDSPEAALGAGTALEPSKDRAA